MDASTNPADRRIMTKRLKSVSFMKLQDRRLEPAERLFGYDLLELAGLKVPAGKQGHQVVEASASELRSEGHPKHVGVGGIVQVLLLMLQPFHGLKIFRAGKLAVARQIGIRFRRDGEMAEVVDALTELVAVIPFVWGLQRRVDGWIEFRRCLCLLLDGLP